MNSRLFSSSIDILLRSIGALMRLDGRRVIGAEETESETSQVSEPIH